MVIEKVLGFVTGIMDSYSQKVTPRTVSRKVFGNGSMKMELSTLN